MTMVWPTWIAASRRRRTAWRRSPARRVYVLSGWLRLVLGDQDLILEPGDAADAETIESGREISLNGMELHVAVDGTGEVVRLGSGNECGQRSRHCDNRSFSWNRVRV